MGSLMPPFDPLQDKEKPEGLGCAHCDLAELAFCAGLKHEDVSRLTAILGHVQLPPHTSIFREGDSAQHLYSIASGSVKLYKLLSDGRRQITGFLFPGNFFGLSTPSGYAYTAESLTPVSLCRFPRRKLEALYQTVPQLEKRLLDITISELTGAHDQMLLLGRKTAKEKVASFIVGLERRTRRLRQGPAVALPMSRSDIADYLGLTIETVSRVMTNLKKEGIIGLPDAGHLLVKDHDTLARLAEGA